MRSDTGGLRSLVACGRGAGRPRIPTCRVVASDGCEWEATGKGDRRAVGQCNSRRDGLTGRGIGPGRESRPPWQGTPRLSVHVAFL